MRAVLNRLSRVVSVFATVALLPLVASPFAADKTSSTEPIALAVSVKPVSFGVEVATVILPLDLAKLTNADFGDTDVRN
jgi:hypothetical protein